MSSRIASIAYNTYREAVRDRVLYNLVVFALLLVTAALLVGQISIGIERVVMVNLGLTAITFFGVAIAIFIGIGLVSKEIEKKTLYTVLARPVRRWEFILGKFLGLVGTLAVNTLFMALGFFAALFFLVRDFERSDVSLFAALYFIVLQLVIVTAVALLFSSFSSPLLSAVLSLSLFVIGNFAQDLRAFASLMTGVSRWLALAVAYVLPNLSSFNVVSSVAHSQPVPVALVLWNTAYALLYAGAAVAGAVLVFDRRNLK